MVDFVVQAFVEDITATADGLDCVATVSTVRGLTVATFALARLTSTMIVSELSTTATLGSDPKPFGLTFTKTPHQPACQVWFQSMGAYLQWAQAPNIPALPTLLLRCS